MISATIETVTMFAFKTFLTIVLASGFVSAIRGQENDILPDIHQTIFAAIDVGLGKSKFYIMLLYIIQYNCIEFNDMKTNNLLYQSIGCYQNSDCGSNGACDTVTNRCK